VTSNHLLPLQRHSCLLFLTVSACICSIAGFFQAIFYVLHILPYSDKLLNQRLTILFYLNCVKDSCCLLSSALVTRILCKICLSRHSCFSNGFDSFWSKATFGINIDYPVIGSGHYTQSMTELRFSTARRSINLCNLACLNTTIQ
jgi:hypothetical protein